MIKVIACVKFERIKGTLAVKCDNCEHMITDKCHALGHKLYVYTNGRHVYYRADDTLAWRNMKNV